MAEKQEGQKFQQYFCAIAASIGALAIGNIVAWTSPCLLFLSSNNFSAPLTLQSSTEGDLIAAFMPFGAILGTLPAGLLADSFGRKLTLLIFSVPLIISWIITTVAANVTTLYVARFVAGIVFGLICGVLPMYINEIAEDSIRGTLGTFFQVFFTIGQLIVYTLGILNSYTILCYCLIAISIGLFFGLLIIPETPTYLIKKNRLTEAERVLKKLRGPHYDVLIELNEIRSCILHPNQQKFLLSTLRTKAKIKSLIICIGLMFFQQFCGINAVIFFADTIFRNAGASSPTICTIIVSITQTVATIFSSILIDRAGRKILLSISSVIAGLCLVALGYYFWILNHKMDVSQVSWLPLSSLVFFIVGFSLGLGPIPWIMSVEVFAPEIRSFGATLTAATNLTGVTFITFFFQPLTKLISTAYTFWLFAVICLFSTIFVSLVLPETKGKSVQEVQNILAGKNSQNMDGNNS